MALLLQDIDDIIKFYEEDWRIRGGLDVQAVLRAASDAGIRAGPDLCMEVLSDELQSRMDQKHGDQVDPSRAPARMNTVRRFQRNADSPIAANCSVTTRQACFCMAALKLRGGVTDQTFDDFCNLLASSGFLPAENNMMPRCVPHCRWLAVYMLVTRARVCGDTTRPFDVSTYEPTNVLMQISASH